MATHTLCLLLATLALSSAAPHCDFSQVPENGPYNKTKCDRDFFDANYAIERPCGHDPVSGATYPNCTDVRNTMPPCNKKTAGWSNCRFGDSFIGKIGCLFQDGKLLPNEDQPATCKTENTWCCPCGYDNDGDATRACGLYRSDEQAWSAYYFEENLLPEGYQNATTKDVEGWGWYLTEQNFEWCNVGGRCYELSGDDPDATPGGCGIYKDTIPRKCAL